MIKFEKITQGMTLYDVRKADWRARMAFNSRWSTFPVSIVEVYPDRREVLASWNNNPATIMSERRVTNLRAKQPN